MLFNSNSYYILMIVAAIVFSFALSLGLRKFLSIRKTISDYEINTYAFTTGLISLVIGIIVLYNTPADLVVIHDDNTYSDYIFFGEIEFENNGNIYVLKEEDGNDSFIINGTSKLLVFESIDYGDPIFSFSMPNFIGTYVDGIEADSLRIDSSLPDYFPWESPPESVMVSKGIDHDSKEWLRPATSEEEQNYFDSEEAMFDYANPPDYNLLMDIMGSQE